MSVRKLIRVALVLAPLLLSACARAPAEQRLRETIHAMQVAIESGDTRAFIEHVGDEDAQLAHLREIRRVLRADGHAYLAVPNRWMLTEPHYRLKFLSWLPKPWRTPYLRWSGKGDLYDCEPLELAQIEAMLATSGVSSRNICVEGLRETLEIERPDALATRLLRRVPDNLLKPFRGLIPTLIYRIEKSGHGR